nr:heavy metal translocating P-type ATPase [Paenibacillus sp. 32O-W]
MKEYRVKGLSCGNCAQELERQIRQLPFGDSASLCYNSGKLTIDSRIEMKRVAAILKSDGAFLVSNDGGGAAAAVAACSCENDVHRHDTAGNDRSHDHAHDHVHEHDHGHDHVHDHAEAQRHDEGHEHHHEHGAGNRMLRWLIFSAVLYAAALAIPLLAGSGAEGSAAVGAGVSAALYLLSIALSGYRTFLRGIRNLVRLRFNIDTLMSIALIGAVAIGEWKEATLVALLFGVNELLEGYGMEKARRSMEAILQAAPKEAVRLEGGRERIVPIAALAANDTVVVKPGGKIPSDGTIVHGASSVNEAAITGESMPVEKNAGDFVYGGSINNEGLLHVRIDRPYRDSSLAKILHLVEEAQETKTPTELFINRFARYYTPLIIAVALVVFLAPPLLFGGDWMTWLYQGLAVLIVGCPCALILSSPIAIVSGIARSARDGILIKGGVFLEQLGKLDTIAFDKTGTLTKGEPHVVRTVVYDEERFYDVAAAIESTSSHPLAKAVLKETSRLGVVPRTPDRVETLSGRGIVAAIDGTDYYAGNETGVGQLALSEKEQADIAAMKAEGLTIVLVADGSKLLGMFGIADEIREESRQTIAELHRRGIRTVMLTGDHRQTAEKVARAVGVDEFYGGLLPEDKVARVKELAARGKVGMIGDGINDAPALASAHLGIAMGKGTDSAIETADIVLMQDHLGKLPEAVSVSRKVNRIIRFNIAVSLGLKLLALLLTIPGWLTLWIAILSDMGATVFVTLVSLTVLLPGRGKGRG